MGLCGSEDDDKVKYNTDNDISDIPEEYRNKWFELKKREVETRSEATSKAFKAFLDKKGASAKFRAECDLSRNRIFME